MASERFPELGSRIRALRQRKGLTLKDLSRQCKLSVSFLSQIERGLSSFSIPSLRAICQALDVSLPDLLVLSDGPGMAFLADPRPSEITKGDNQSCINLSDTSIKYRFLSGGFPVRQFEVLIGEMSPGYENPPTSHEGEEFGYILEGMIELTIDEETYSLGPGDSYHIAASTAHGCQTKAEGSAKVLWVQTAKFAQSLSLLSEEKAATEGLGFSLIKLEQNRDGENHPHVNLLDASVKYRFLSGNFPERQFEVFIGEMPAGCHRPPGSHEGEEFGYVLEGRVKLTIGKESYTIGPDDSYHLVTTTPHTCGTSDKEGAKVLWAQTSNHPIFQASIRRESKRGQTAKETAIESQEQALENARRR